MPSHTPDISNAPEPAEDDGDLDLSTRIARLAAERDEAVAAKKRSLADFANFQRRANESEIRAFQNGAARVVRSLLGPLDHFDLALSAAGAAASANPAAKTLLDGVRMVRGEIAKALDEHGVTTIVPVRGEEFDPLRHEAVMRQADPELPRNSIVQTLQPGYALGEMIVRPAKVAVVDAGD